MHLFSLAVFTTILPPPSAPAIVVDQVTFEAASHEVATAGELTEYIPAGEKLDAWTRLVGIRHFKSVNDPLGYIANLATIYHRKFPQVSFEAKLNPKTAMGSVSFFEPAPTYIEWDYFRARKSATGRVIVWQYAVKLPRDVDLRSQIEALPKHMTPILDAMNFPDAPK